MRVGPITPIQPVFWLSGIIFNVSNISIAWIQKVLLFNPVTFFATAYRNALFSKAWVWENPELLGAFCIVFLVTLIVMSVLYKRLAGEVSDVL